MDFAELLSELPSASSRIWRSYPTGALLRSYRKTDEDLNIGNVTATQINYIFVHDKFYAVSIHADGRFNGTNLLKVFQAAFGAGAHPEGTPTQYYWTGKVAGAHFFEDDGTEPRGERMDWQP